MGSSTSKVGTQPTTAATAAARPGSPSRLARFFPGPHRTAPNVIVPSAARIVAATPTAKTHHAPLAPPTLGPTVAAICPLPSLSSPPRQQQSGADELPTQLLKAVKNGDLRAVERVIGLARGRQQDLLDIRGMWESTPLIYACQYGHEPIAQWLLDAGARVDLVNERGVTALVLASLEGMTAVVARILHLVGPREDGAAPLPPPPALGVGVVYNATVDLNVRVDPLLAACMNGHAAIAELLLEHGLDPNAGVASAGSGTTSSAGGLQYPLLAAARYGHTAVIQVLLRPRDPASPTALDVCEANGNHALLLACDGPGKQDCALALMEHLAGRVEEDADRQDAWKGANAHGLTALHQMAIHGLGSACEFLLYDLAWKDDADFVNATSSTRRETALLMACRKRQFDVVRLLIVVGADAAIVDRGGTSALDILGREKREDLIGLWRGQGRQPRGDANVSEQQQQQPRPSAPTSDAGEQSQPSGPPDPTQSPDLLAPPEIAAHMDAMAPTDLAVASPIDPGEGPSPLVATSSMTTGGDGDDATPTTPATERPSDLDVAIQQDSRARRGVTRQGSKRQSKDRRDTGFMPIQLGHVASLARRSSRSKLDTVAVAAEDEDDEVDETPQSSVPGPGHPTAVVAPTSTESFVTPSAVVETDVPRIREVEPSTGAPHDDSSVPPSPKKDKRRRKKPSNRKKPIDDAPREASTADGAPPRLSNVGDGRRGNGEREVETAAAEEQEEEEEGGAALGDAEAFDTDF